MEVKGTVHAGKCGRSCTHRRCLDFMLSSKGSQQKNCKERKGHDQVCFSVVTPQQGREDGLEGEETGGKQTSQETTAIV